MASEFRCRNILIPKFFMDNYFLAIKTEYWAEGPKVGHLQELANESARRAALLLVSKNVKQNVIGNRRVERKIRAKNRESQLEC